MKKKFNYNQFDIGDWVKIYKRILVISEGHKRRRVDIPTSLNPILGRIIGVKALREGTLSFSYDYGFGETEPPEFHHTNTILCWTIKTGLTNKPIYALPEDIELCSVEDIDEVEFPIIEGDFKSQWSGDYGEHWKEEMRKDCKNWPRDEKGRWTKEIPDRKI